MEISPLSVKRHAGQYSGPHPPAAPPALLLENKHVLIVDDDWSFRSLLKVILTQIGWPLMGVWEAVDSPTAVAICHNHPIDLVFCDLNLHIEEPGQCQNGLEIIEELRHSHPHTPVYMVTADGSATLIEQVCAVGATGHLLKPINLRTVKRILVAHFSRNPEGDFS